MPRYNSKKPFEQEIRSFLHALELHDTALESENRPLVDIYETEKDLVLEFDLPGFELSEISVTIQGAAIVLDARRPCGQAVENSRFICLERRYGVFHHAVNFPCHVDPAKIIAEYRRGVLRLFCPKIKEHQVPIKEILD